MNSFDVLNENEELAVLVNANSEYEINSTLSEIKSKGYCNKISKLIKIN